MYTCMWRSTYIVCVPTCTRTCDGSESTILVLNASFYILQISVVTDRLVHCTSESMVASLCLGMGKEIWFCRSEVHVLARDPNIHSIWEKVLQRDFYNLVWHYDTGKSTFQYTGGKKYSAQKLIFVVFFLIKIFCQV